MFGGYNVDPRKLHKRRSYFKYISISSFPHRSRKRKVQQRSQKGLMGAPYFLVKGIHPYILGHTAVPISWWARPLYRVLTFQSPLFIKGIELHM